MAGRRLRAASTIPTMSTGPSQAGCAVARGMAAVVRDTPAPAAPAAGQEGGAVSADRSSVFMSSSGIQPS